MAPSSGRARPEPEERKLIGINKETITHTVSTDFPDNYPGEPNLWSATDFRSQFSVLFHQNTPRESQFSLVGLDASVANAFRRILIAEIPTLAIETVFVYNNTSVIQDEVLAHRLGLIPFTGNRRAIRDMEFWRKPSEEDGEGAFDTTTDVNTVALELKVKCTLRRHVARGERDPTNLYEHAHVYARDIVFKPEGSQEEHFSSPDDVIRPVNPDILVAKLRPGQTLDLEMHMHKGVGADHAKFSPVATASYRLMPTIDILAPILGDDARKFQKCFSPGVIELESVTAQEARSRGSGYEGKEGECKAVVRDPMKDTVSRECLRHEEFAGKVKLGRRRDHFIFAAESTGQWEGDELFLEAVRTMKGKVRRLRWHVNAMSEVAVR